MISSSKKLTKIAQLQAQLKEKEAVILSQLTQLENQSKKLESKEKRIALLEEMVRYLRVKRFMASSEKTSSAQISLFDEAELFTDPALLDFEKDDQADEEKKKATTERKKPGRKPFSPDLPRVQILLPLTEEEKAGAKSTFFVKVKEELDYVPAKFQILEYMQEKAIFEQEDTQSTTVKTAELPKHPIPGAVGSINLITHAIVTKYADGLPLYRIAKQFERSGGGISVATLASYVIKSAALFQPLINLLREQQQAGRVIAMDETTVQVLKEPDKAVTSDKYMWVSLGGPPDKLSVLFHYDPSRKKEIPVYLLDGFSGYLQTDGYSGYNEACRKYGLISVGCMDHARRKFKVALDKQLKRKKGTPPTATDIIFAHINKLYMVERKIVELKLVGEKIVAYRQEHSKPLLDKIKRLLDTHVMKIPKDSDAGAAIHYMLNQWDKLTVYCTHHELRISNIMAENAIRPFAVGRRAWLFADTPSGAKASAICYSIIETAKLHGLNPSEYIHTLLARLPYAQTVEEIEKLLPWSVSRTKDESLLELYY